MADAEVPRAAVPVLTTDREQRALGGGDFRHYVGAKLAEDDEFATHVSDSAFDRYPDQF